MRGLTFRIADIPVRVDVSFWLIMGLFGFERAAATGSFQALILVEWVSLVFAGILIHELGHAIAFRTFGRKPSVTLYGMGGLTSASGGLSPGKRLITTLAGPGFGFALTAIVLVVFASGIWQPGVFEGASIGQVISASLPFPDFVGGRLGEQILLDLVFINLGWGLLNLIPLYPLDGGQSLESVLQLFRVKPAEQITSMVGIVLASGAGVWALRRGQVFLLLIMVFLGISNVNRLRPRRAGPPAATDPRARQVSPELAHAAGLADQALSQGRADDAIEVMAQEYQYRPTVDSARAYVTVLARTRRFDQIESLVTQDLAHMEPDVLGVASAALVAGGRYESALRTAEAGWNADQQQNWSHAVNAAAARAGLRDVDGAIRWLFTAADRGWDDRQRLESDPAFAEVRADPRMMEVVSRMQQPRT